MVWTGATLVLTELTESSARQLASGEASEAESFSSVTEQRVKRRPI